MALHHFVVNHLRRALFRLVFTSGLTSRRKTAQLAHVFSWLIFCINAAQPKWNCSTKPGGEFHDFFFFFPLSLKSSCMRLYCIILGMISWKCPWYLERLFLFFHYSVFFFLLFYKLWIQKTVKLRQNQTGTKALRPLCLPTSPNSVCKIYVGGEKKEKHQ